MKYLYSLYIDAKLASLFTSLLFCSVLVACIYSGFLVPHRTSSVETLISSTDTPAHYAPTSGAPSLSGNVNLELRKGDTLSGLLENANVSKTDIFAAVQALSPYHDLENLHIGQKIALTFDTADNATATPADSTQVPLLQALAIKTAPEKELRLTRAADGTFVVKETILPLTRKVTRMRGTIDSSLLATTASLGVPANVMVDLVKAYSYDIDFQRDIQPGDQFEVVLEQFYTPDGELARDGDALYSSLKTGDKLLTIYHYTPKDGEAGYFTADGRNVRKDLLRTPLNIVHISSTFGIRRHPVLGYTKMHKGVDFAASTGTPILAAGAGVVEEIGRKGTYGNYIRIRHTTKYSTAYAHASRFAKLKQGDKVKQGDVIAYVGSTGRATGPHLHYEVLVNNRQVDPLSIKMTPGIKLQGTEWTRFTAQKQKLVSLLATLPIENNVAMSTTTSTDIASQTNY